MTRKEGHSARNMTNCGDDPALCPQCGQALKSAGLEQFLGRLGISDEMLTNLKSAFQNVDVEEYLNTAREYLNQPGESVPYYVKENPGKVVAGVAAFALGAGLVWSLTRQARPEELEDRVRQLELKRALAGPKHRLDEVLSELGVAV